MSKRVTIGRKLIPEMQVTRQPERNKETIFTLASGKKAHFFFKHLSPEDISEKTFVDLATNGRDQNALTADSVADIMRTLPLQQFFPAIGRQLADGKIEILDGSRRRAAALYCHTGLDILVSDDTITSDDARQLAADIQTAREHNLREIGLQLLILRDAGMSQKEIAHHQRLSQAKVTRAIQAASVPEIMLHIFPVQSELTYPDYRTLLDLHHLINAKRIDLSELIQIVAEQKNALDEKLPADQFKDALMRVYKRETENLLSKPARKTVSTEHLWHFSEKNTFARIKNKKGVTCYEFSRIPKDVLNEIRQAIQDTLEKRFKA